VPLRGQYGTMVQQKIFTLILQIRKALSRKSFWMFRARETDASALLANTLTWRCNSSSKAFKLGPIKPLLANHIDPVEPSNVK